MKLLQVLISAAALGVAAVPPVSVAGIRALAKRLLGDHDDQFDFHLTEQHENWSRYNIPTKDNYTVTLSGDKIRVEGTTLSALARGFVFACLPLEIYTST